MHPIRRRDLLRAGAAAGLWPFAGAAAAAGWVPWRRDFPAADGRLYDPAIWTPAGRWGTDEAYYSILEHNFALSTAAGPQITPYEDGIFLRRRVLTTDRAFADAANALSPPVHPRRARVPLPVAPGVDVGVGTLLFSGIHYETWTTREPFLNPAVARLHPPFRVRWQQKVPRASSSPNGYVRGAHDALYLMGYEPTPLTPENTGNPRHPWLGSRLLLEIDATEYAGSPAWRGPLPANVWGHLYPAEGGWINQHVAARREPEIFQPVHMRDLIGRWIDVEVFVDTDGRAGGTKRIEQWIDGTLARVFEPPSRWNGQPPGGDVTFEARGVAKTVSAEEMRQALEAIWDAQRYRLHLGVTQRQPSMTTVGAWDYRLEAEHHGDYSGWGLRRFEILLPANDPRL